jgi:hypothetical protein
MAGQLVTSKETAIGTEKKNGRIDELVIYTFNPAGKRFAFQEVMDKNSIRIIVLSKGNNGK